MKNNIYIHQQTKISSKLVIFVSIFYHLSQIILNHSKFIEIFVLMKLLNERVLSSFCCGNNFKVLYMKNFKTVLNAKINAIIGSIYSIVKVNGFTYTYTYTFIPIPGGRGA